MKVLAELLSTEETYLRDLDIIVEHISGPLERLSTSAANLRDSLDYLDPHDIEVAMFVIPFSENSPCSLRLASCALSLTVRRATLFHFSCFRHSSNIPEVREASKALYVDLKRAYDHQGNVGNAFVVHV
jgi:hypothetical protein